jgi:hypothetical protein
MRQYLIDASACHDVAAQEEANDVLLRRLH